MKNFLVWFIDLKTQKGNCGYQFTLRQTDTVTHLNAQINKNAERYIELVANTVYHIFICIGNEEPRGAWKILAGFDFGGNSAQSSALRADAFFGGNASPEFLRCMLDKVRNYFELNPND